MGLEGTRVLYISYTGMLDPLGQSQVLPYLRELVKRGIRFTLISFERPATLSDVGLEKCEALRHQLAADNIAWQWLRYHQKPSLPATAYDVAAGIRLALALVKRDRIELVHARSHIPATIALAIKKRTGIKMIFDVRGLMAEEYVDAEHWQQESIAYRLTKAMERRALAASDGVVTLTEKIWPIISSWDGLRGRKLEHSVIPCCIDLDSFSFNAADRERRRRELNLDDRFTLVYSGSIGGWYLSDKMADFFVKLLKHTSNAYFLWLTPGDPQLIMTLMNERGISTTEYLVKKLASADVPSYLSAGDAGIAFYKPGFSKLATSPVKVSEYLACGLPMIMNAGIGDSDALAEVFQVGVLVNEFSAEEYGRAAAEIERLVYRREARTKVRVVAENLFDLRRVGTERYASLYERVLNRN
jgi:glycosyltransferase involved in cell wall biosynthesis